MSITNEVISLTETIGIILLLQMNQFKYMNEQWTLTLRNFATLENRLTCTSAWILYGLQVSSTPSLWPFTPGSTLPKCRLQVPLVRKRKCQLTIWMVQISGKNQAPPDAWAWERKYGHNRRESQRKRHRSVYANPKYSLPAVIAVYSRDLRSS